MSLGTAVNMYAGDQVKCYKGILWGHTFCTSVILSRKNDWIESNQCLT